MLFKFFIQKSFKKIMKFIVVILKNASSEFSWNTNING